MIALLLALVMPSEVVGVWAPDQEACRGRAIIVDGEYLGIADPIERETFSRTGKYNKYETSGQVTRVETRGTNHFAYMVLRDEDGSSYRNVFRLSRVGDRLRVHDLGANITRLLVRC